MLTTNAYYIPTYTTFRSKRYWFR